MSATPDGPGHVFVAKADLRNLACDVYLLSGDRQLRSTSKWATVSDDAERRLDQAERTDYMAERRYTLPMRVPDPASSEATPIVTAVPYYGVRDAAELQPRVEEFFRVAATFARDRRVSHRERPLVAIPLFAGYKGGGGPLRGDILRLLYDESRRACMLYGYDVVIALRDPRAYDLAQTIRRETGAAWTQLTAWQRNRAADLGAQASAQRLVPFMGSGISVSAGAPTWQALIEELAKVAGLPREDAQRLAKDHDVLDQAAYIHQLFSRAFPTNPTAFADAVIGAVDKPRYGLAPALLASLEAEQAITLNYDRLFELAAEDAQLRRRVIPGPSNEEERWLLKLHGTVRDKSSIVLTRDDYLGFNADRAALSALVKATLMTRHLLFVGFGMSDAHFHEIVHDVRRALPQRESTFGTVLTLSDDSVTRRLWEGDLDFLRFGSPRQLEIFLDALLAFASDNHSYLLAHGYESALPDQDQRLADAVERMLPALTPELLDTPAGRVLSGALRDLGWDGVTATGSRRSG